MNWLIFFVGVVIGSIVGIFVLSILIGGSNSEKIEEAYRKGYKKDLKMAK